MLDKLKKELFVLHAGAASRFVHEDREGILVNTLSACEACTGARARSALKTSKEDFKINGSACGDG